jgi:hypothetical protein
MAPRVVMWLRNGAEGEIVKIVREGEWTWEGPLDLSSGERASWCWREER